MKDVKSCEEQFEGCYTDGDGWVSWCDGGDDDPANITPGTLQNDGSEGTTPSGKTVIIAGREVHVNSDEDVQALTAYSSEVDRRFSEHSGELGELRQYKRDSVAREESLKPVEPPADWSDLLFSDTNAFVEKIRHDMASQVDKGVNTLRGEYKTAQGESSFWNSFWQENTDLALIKEKAQSVVGVIGNEYKRTNPNVPLQDNRQTRDALAQEARRWLSSISSADINDINTDHLEGGSPPSSSPAKPVAPKRRSTTDIIENRKAEKRKALSLRR